MGRGVVEGRLGSVDRRREDDGSMSILEASFSGVTLEPLSQGGCNRGQQGTCRY